MKKLCFGFFLLSILFASCIGDDLVFDSVPEELRILNPVDSIEVGMTYQFDATFFNNVGVEAPETIFWTSQTPSTASVDQTGLVSALAVGPASILAEVVLPDTTVSASINFSVSAEPVDPPTPPSSGTGTIAATSNYLLEGDFTISEDGGNILLEFASNYKADTALPGLYVYLTNNPNTSNGALEIGAVTVFSGAHSYTIPSTSGLNSFSHVLYFCKPFNVKVGDGTINL